MTPRRWCTWALLALGLLGGTASAGAPAVGWVDRFDGNDPKHYRLLRGGKAIPFGQFTPIYQGDEVIVLHASHAIRLAYENGRVIESVGRSEPAYVVRRVATVPTPWSNVAEWAGTWFSTWQNESATVMSVYVRGGADGPISFPVLARGQGRIVAGARPLYLAWEGGTPPYEVGIVIGAGAAPVVSLAQISSRRARTDRLTLGPGSLQIKVVDKVGRRAVAKVDVVERLPLDPLEVGESPLPPEMRRTLFAVWLASHERGSWTLEAYQLAAAAGETSGGAALLRDALERGSRPTGAPAGR